jgi:hypothetical protein
VQIEGGAVSVGHVDEGEDVVFVFSQPAPSGLPTVARPTWQHWGLCV